MSSQHCLPATLPQSRRPNHQPAYVSNLFQYKIVFAYKKARILEVRVNHSYNFKLVFQGCEKDILRMALKFNLKILTNASLLLNSLASS